MYKEVKLGETVVSVTDNNGKFVSLTDPQYIKWKNGEVKPEAKTKKNSKKGGK